MNETIPDKKAYQTNRRRMCWAALGMMIACTAATIYDPARMSEADSILMAIAKNKGKYSGGSKRINRERVHQLRSEGLSTYKIASMMEISRMSVHRILKEQVA